MSRRDASYLAHSIKKARISSKALSRWAAGLDWTACPSPKHLQAELFKWIGLFGQLEVGEAGRCAALVSSVAREFRVSGDIALRNLVSHTKAEDLIVWRLASLFWIKTSASGDAVDACHDIITVVPAVKTPAYLYLEQLVEEPKVPEPKALEMLLAKNPPQLAAALIANSPCSDTTHLLASLAQSKAIRPDLDADALGRGSANFDPVKYESDEDAAWDLEANSDYIWETAREEFLSETLHGCGWQWVSTETDLEYSDNPMATKFILWWALKPPEIVKKFRTKLRRILSEANSTVKTTRRKSANTLT
jgi:hypothetical protein